jgi:hypothetical protein
VAFFVRFTSNTRAVQRSNNFLRNEMRNAFPFLALVAFVPDIHLLTKFGL